MKILLTGASGLIGRALIPELMKNGHQVFALARRPDSLPELPRHHIQKWSDHEVPDLEFLKNCEAIIHLAGEGIADQLWSEQRKKRLRDSRILGTRHLTQALAKLPPTQRPQVFLSGSAIGIYAQSQNEQNESSPSGHDFLADLTRDWEAEARNCEALGIRTVYLRTGLVLSHLGGLLAKMGPVALGSGQHWMSWIHIKDVVGLIAWALQNPHVQGAVNLTSPQPVQNLEFTKTFCKVKHLPFLGKVPALLIKGIAGELSQALLSDQRVLPSAALSRGYGFQFSNLESALNDLYQNSSFTTQFFSASQFVPLPRNQVFPFFSKAENLEILTPPWLNFHILTKTTPEIEKGTQIQYKLKIHGVPVKWKTLIQEWNPDTSFVDFQLKGPYKIWHHEHFFCDVPGGTLILDQVRFVIPGGILGLLLLPLIRRDVQTIFSYRQKAIQNLVEKGQLK